MPGICVQCNAKFVNKKSKCKDEGHTFVMTRDLQDDDGYCNHRFKIELEHREMGSTTETFKRTLDEGETLTRVDKRPMFILTRSQCIWCTEHFEECVQMKRDENGGFRAVEIPYVPIPRSPRRRRVPAPAPAPVPRAQRGLEREREENNFFF